MDGPQNLAREVRLARIAAGFDRANAFAESLGLTPKTISNIETASRASYSPVTLAKLDLAFGWEAGTAQRLLRGEISQPQPPQEAVPTTEPRVRFNDYDEQIEIEAPDVRINISSGLITVEANYWDKFNWYSIAPDRLVAAGYRARSEFMAALDEIKIESLKPVILDESRLDEAALKNSADPAADYIAAAEAKLQAALQSDYAPAARRHEPDPLEGVGEENQDEEGR